MTTNGHLPSDSEVARALGGRVLPNGKGVEFPIPGAKGRKRTGYYRREPSAIDGFLVGDAAGKADPIELKDLFRDKLGIPFVPKHKNGNSHIIPARSANRS